MNSLFTCSAPGAIALRRWWRPPLFLSLSLFHSLHPLFFYSCLFFFHHLSTSLFFCYNKSLSLSLAFLNSLLLSHRDGIQPWPGRSRGVCVWVCTWVCVRVRASVYIDARWRRRYSATHSGPFVIRARRNTAFRSVRLYVALAFRQNMKRKTWLRYLNSKERERKKWLFFLFRRPLRKVKEKQSGKLIAWHNCPLIDTARECHEVQLHALTQKGTGERRRFTYPLFTF